MKTARLAVMVWRCDMEAQSRLGRLAYAASVRPNSLSEKACASVASRGDVGYTAQSRYASCATEDRSAAWPSQL